MMSSKARKRLSSTGADRRDEVALLASRRGVEAGGPAGLADGGGGLIGSSAGGVDAFGEGAGAVVGGFGAAGDADGDGDAAGDGFGVAPVCGPRSLDRWKKAPTDTIPC